MPVIPSMRATPSCSPGLAFSNRTMSLKGGTAAAGPLSGFSVHINRRAVGKWEGPVLGFPLFHGLVAAVGMWESRQRFPRAVGTEENLPLVFLCVHNPSFPPPFFTPSSSLGFRQNSFSFASCIRKAAAVSLSAPARFSRSACVVPACKCRAKSGNCRRISHGVAYQRYTLLCLPFALVTASGTPRGR
jgi:hypothetical protein